MSKILCIGHRGARGHEPENTLRSIECGLALGADGVEVDVQLCEGQLVVIHDRRVDRTTNGRGRVARKRFEALRALDAGKGEKIPTLIEVLDAVRGRGLLNVELKGRRTAEPVAALIEEEVRQGRWRFADLVVSSFHHRELHALAGSKIPLGILYSRRPRRLRQLAAELRAYSVHTGLRYTRSETCALAHDLGLRIFVYTVNEPAAIERMRRCGVDGVFTDFPERVSGRKGPPLARSLPFE